MLIEFFFEHVTFFEANEKFGRKTSFGTCRDLRRVPFVRYETCSIC